MLWVFFPIRLQTNGRIGSFTEAVISYYNLKILIILQKIAESKKGVVFKISCQYLYFRMDLISWDIIPYRHSDRNSDMVLVSATASGLISNG